MNSLTLPKSNRRGSTCRELVQAKRSKSLRERRKLAKAARKRSGKYREKKSDTVKAA
jgi:hypothetical protein